MRGRRVEFGGIHRAKRRERMTEQNAATGADFAFSPAVLVRLDGDALEVVTVGGGDEEALVVFRTLRGLGYPSGAPRASLHPLFG